MPTFLLSSEQDEIQRAARAFVRERMPVAHLRALRDQRDLLGFSRAHWRAAADLGWAGITIAEEHGGAGLGLVELGLILEECGRTLAPTPLISSTVLGAGALAAAASSLAAPLLAQLAAGDATVAFALEEQPRFAPFAISTTAHRELDGAGWRLDGAKVHVLDGAAASHLIVVARIPTPGIAEGSGPVLASARANLALFLVAASAPGVTVTPLTMVDARGAARVRLDQVVVPDEALLVRADASAQLIDTLLDRATAALCAEMLGGAQEAFERTIAYLKERQQFGVPIGSFQALKHRAAHMFCELELTRSVVRAALVAVDGGAADAPALVAAAKAKTSETFIHVTAEAIQLHGGIGVTDDLDLGLFYKRARACELTFGDAPYHRDRFGRLAGY